MTKIQAHPTDAELLEYLDGELSPEQDTAVREHLVDCAHCREVVQEFTDGSTQIEELLGAIQLNGVRAPRLAIVTQNPQYKWYSRRSLRAALVLFAVGAATMVVSPVRAWVLDFLTNAIQVNDPPPTPMIDDQSENAVQNSASVRFVPSSTSFEIVIARLQSAGSLYVRVGNDTRATGNIIDQQVSDELLVTGTGLRILNSEMSTSSYEIVIPASITELVLNVPGRTPMRLSSQTLDNSRGLTISLVSGTIQ